jgi:hypothetical protein
MHILDAQVRRVCQNCNGGWMSQLEAQAKPLLEPMFDGKPMTLMDRVQVLERLPQLLAAHCYSS